MTAYDWIYVAVMVTVTACTVAVAGLYVAERYQSPIGRHSRRNPPPRPQSPHVRVIQGGLAPPYDWAHDDRRRDGLA